MLATPLKIGALNFFLNEFYRELCRQQPTSRFFVQHKAQLLSTTPQELETVLIEIGCKYHVIS